MLLNRNKTHFVKWNNINRNATLFMYTWIYLYTFIYTCTLMFSYNEDAY